MDAFTKTNTLKQVIGTLIAGLLTSSCNHVLLNEGAQAYLQEKERKRVAVNEPQINSTTSVLTVILPKSVPNLFPIALKTAENLNYTVEFQKRDGDYAKIKGLTNKKWSFLIHLRKHKNDHSIVEIRVGNQGSASAAKKIYLALNQELISQEEQNETTQKTL